MIESSNKVLCSQGTLINIKHHYETKHYSKLLKIYRQFANRKIWSFEAKNDWLFITCMPPTTEKATHFRKFLNGEFLQTKVKKSKFNYVKKFHLKKTNLSSTESSTKNLCTLVNSTRRRQYKTVFTFSIIAMSEVPENHKLNLNRTVTQKPGGLWLNCLCISRFTAN